MRGFSRLALFGLSLPVLLSQLLPKPMAASDWRGCCLGNPREFTADATGLYWEQGHVEGPFSETPYVKPTIRSLAKSGGSPKILATIAGRASYLARCDGGLCWSQEGKLWYLPDGGSPKTVASGKDDLRCVVMDGRWAYWIAESSIIRRVEVRTGQVQDVSGSRIRPGSRYLSALSFQGERCMGMDSANLYTIEATENTYYLVSVPKSGGPAVRRATLAAGTTTVSDIMADDRYIYWLRWPEREPRPRGTWAGDIQRVAKSGGDAVTVVPLSEGTFGMALAGSRIAYVTRSGKVKITREKGEPLVLFKGPDADEVAADERAVYWVSSEIGVFSALIPQSLRSGR